MYENVMIFSVIFSECCNMLMIIDVFYGVKIFIIGLYYRVWIEIDIEFKLILVLVFYIC